MQFRKLINRVLALWYVRAGLFAGVLGWLLLIMIVCLGLQHHLATANPIFAQALYGKGVERLLCYYDALAAMNAVITLMPWFVLSPTLVVGFVSFSINAARPVNVDGSSVSEDERVKRVPRVSRLEANIYGSLILFVLVVWILIFFFARQPFRGLMIKFGVPNSAGQFSE